MKVEGEMLYGRDALLSHSNKHNSVWLLNLRIKKFNSKIYLVRIRIFLRNINNLYNDLGKWRTLK